MSIVRACKQHHRGGFEAAGVQAKAKGLDAALGSVAHRHKHDGRVAEAAFGFLTTDDLRQVARDAGPPRYTLAWSASQQLVFEDSH